MTQTLLILAIGVYLAGALYLLASQLRRIGRNNRVCKFRIYILNLDKGYAYRTGDLSFRYYNCLPPYESMLDDGLPLTLDSYFYESEIRRLLGWPEKKEKT